MLGVRACACAYDKDLVPGFIGVALLFAAKNLLDV